MKPIFLIQILLLTAFKAFPANAAEEGLKGPIPTDPAVIIKKLPNGLTYYIRQNAKPENRIELRLAINAGSALEDEDQRGLAHFLEHMAFNGTENFEKEELVDYLQTIGIRFGADLNAHTGFDETVYKLQVPVEDEAVLEKAFLIMSDWAHKVSLDPEEIEKERGVVLEEWRSRRGAGSRQMEAQLPLLLHGSKYPDRLPIGSVDVIQHAKPEAFQRFYKDWYRTDLMALVVVGDIDPARAEALIKKYMSPIPAPINPRARETFPTPNHKETLYSSFSDPELTRSTVQIAYKHNPTRSVNLSDFRASIVRRLYQGLLNQRLYEKTKEANPPFIYGYSSMSNYVRSKNLYFQSAMVKENAFEEGLTALLSEGVRVKRDGFVQSELDREKTSILRSLERALEEKDKNESAGYVDQYVYHFLEQSPIPGIENSVKYYREFLPTITIEEVNKAADNWITEENRVILVSGPEKEGLKLPTREEILATIAKVEGMDIKAYEDTVSDAPLVANKPTPGKIVETETIEEIGVESWTLSNGVKVVLKNTDFKNDEIRFTAFSKGGTSLTSDEDYIAAFTATSLVEESGLGTFDSIQLEKKLTGKVVSVSPFIGETQEGFRGGASPKDLETMFQLLYLYFTQPRINQKAFDSVMTRWKTAVENRDAQPERVFGDEIMATLYNNHGRRQPFTLETLKEMNPEKSLAFYKERFADAGDFTFIFVGNLTAETLKPLTETWLGGLPNLKRDETWRWIGDAYATGQHEVKIRKGLEPKSSVRMIFSGNALWNEKNNYAISSLNQALRIKLREVLREDMGGVYGVSVGGSIDKRPVERFTSSVSFSCDPEKVNDLVNAVKAELENVKKNGIEESYLTKVREAQKRSFEVNVKRNGFWLGNLNFHYTYGLDPRKIVQQEEQMKMLSSDLLKEAANTYYSGENFVFAVLYPAKEESSEKKDIVPDN